MTFKALLFKDVYISTEDFFLFILFDYLNTEQNKKKNTEHYAFILFSFKKYVTFKYT